MPVDVAPLVYDLRAAVVSITGGDSDHDRLIDSAARARMVCLGEATHGTHEFYAERARITKRLIRERGIGAVAVEADWPDAYRVNCYVRGASDDQDAEVSLRGFRRFPSWMWRNEDVRAFVDWLRVHNQALPPGAPKVGFYGLDLYSLHASIAAVLRYLDRVDPDAAARARERYACFDHADDTEGQRYGHRVELGVAEPCDNEVLDQLVELRRHAGEYAQRDGRVPEDAQFFAEQNARLVRNAERYYRAMFRGRGESWNLRDRHMAETLDELLGHLERAAEPARAVVWEHNSHVGDARATELFDRSGELSLGQLVRERHPEEALLVGFTTFDGTVTAASEWGGAAETKTIRPALEYSYEDVFHDTEVPAFTLDLQSDDAAVEELRLPRLERAIGVIYRPQTERASHYFSARLPDQFDAVIHIDHTRAVQPLDPSPPESEPEDFPETFPTGQ